MVVLIFFLVFVQCCMLGRRERERERKEEGTRALEEIGKKGWTVGFDGDRKKFEGVKMRE